MLGLNGVNSINTSDSFGRLLGVMVLASVGGGRIGQASRRRDRPRKEEKKEEGNERGQRPQSQIKALSLPAA